MIVRTAIGTLWGRDCIFLDTLSMPDRSILQLEGTINTSIVRDFVEPSRLPNSGHLPYVLTFRDVLAVKIIELDIWLPQVGDENLLLESSFVEVENSGWIASLRGKISDADRHFVVATYDDVVEVICRSYDLNFDDD